MEVQVMQALLSTAAMLLIVISLRATQLLPVVRESDRIVQVELPERSLAVLPERETRRIGITFYTAPAPFEGAEGVRQTLAIHSWLRLDCRPDVVLMGRHPSLKSFAQPLEPHVSVDSDIDITFMGNPMFHSMIRQAQASSSEIIVLIDPNLVLLNDFTAAITKVRAAEKNWLLVVKPIRTSMFPFDLLGPSELWLRSDGVFADDDEVRKIVKFKGVSTDCYGPGLWAWNKGDAQLHAGVVPPFVYGSGHHSEWLLTEALVSKYRTVIDGSDVITLVAPQTITSRLYNGDGAHGRPWDVAGNSVLAMQYGSLYYKPADLSNVTMKLVKCGGKVRYSLCLYNRTEVLEACKPHNRKLRLAQKSDPPASSQDWFSFGQWFGRSASARKLQALDCKTIALATDEYLRCPRLTKKSVKGSELWLPFSLEALVARVASPDKVVVLSVVGDSYRAMLMSWVCSLRRLNISNYLVYALDDELYQHAVSQGVPVVKSSQTMRASRDDCHFGTKCFQDVTKMKSRTVLHLLQLGFKVLFSDVDVYWFQNPIPEMMSYGPGTLVAQTDQYNDTEAANLPRRLNSGFYFAWPDRATVNVFVKIVKHGMTSNMSEQPSFYDTMCGIDGEHRQGDDRCVEPETNVTAIFLDRRLYPNGASGNHWEQSNVRESCERQGCRVLHNNWVAGRERKLKRQVAAGLWDYDETTRLCLMRTSKQ
ncbi:hypothetical protein KC19_6G180200 [Ceratodon purpureus]|uniref:Nucleotide-diphospho-sugar transferase domain-containing protein n=1 Tax=Ceratodon purpureus TaxID=3225 RepID=A0A8T0HJ19_CERPU|nr:hypothetical protein KC19_6G180200 [Ceratodon purpureus]